LKIISWKSAEQALDKGEELLKQGKKKLFFEYKEGTLDIDVGVIKEDGSWGNIFQFKTRNDIDSMLNGLPSDFRQLSFAKEGIKNLEVKVLKGTKREFLANWQDKRIYEMLKKLTGCSGYCQVQ
jgi:hypothetical protein